MEEKKQETKAEPKEEKKEVAEQQEKKENKEEKKKVKLPAKIVGPKETKHEATIKGSDLPISTKHAIAICKFIKDKTIQKAVLELEQVIKFKRAVPFKGEIPHRHGKGMAAGRYPIKAAKVFIKLLRNLSANAVINGLDVDNLAVSAKSDIASRRRSSRKYRRFKRSHVLLIAREARKKKKIKGKENKPKRKAKEQNKK